MCMGIDELARSLRDYAAPAMDWTVVRRHFKIVRKRRKLTQTKVAEKGKIAQSIVSRIESDPTYMAEADSFLNAVEGLGLSLSSFFAELENPQKVVTMSDKIGHTESRQIVQNAGRVHAGTVSPDPLFDLQAIVSTLGETLVRAFENVSADRAEGAPRAVDVPARTRGHRKTARSRA